jgi:hypothetical protein
MTCSATPATAYWWYRDGVYVDNVQTLTLNTHTVGSFSYQCVVYNGSSSTPSSAATLTVSAPAAVTYPSYNSIGGAVEEDYGSPAVWSIDRGGGTTTGSWANGTGDGTLYGVSASGASGPSSVDFASSASASWSLSAPSTVGARHTATLAISVYIKSTGQTVASGSITLIAQNGGVQQ